MNKIKTYGFIYLWYDKRDKRFYLGSHWGFEDDKYDSSSKYFNPEYKLRPQDFKRRILERIYTSEIDLIEREADWLSLIEYKELGKKYYNKNKGRFFIPTEGKENFRGKVYEIIFTNGNIIRIKSLRRFALDNGYNPDNIGKAFRKRNKYRDIKIINEIDQVE